MLSLQTGIIYQMAQNDIVALPAKRCLLFTDGTAPTFSMSLSSTITASTTITLGTNNQFETAGGFLKLTSSTTINVILASPTA